MKWIVLILLLALPLGLKAQFWNEWFNQKNTQKKYLLQQIAALKIYTGYLNKGYDIVQEGTGLIGDIRRGELSLHKDYFGRLKNVNPVIKGYSKVNTIKEMAVAISNMRIKVLSLALDTDHIPSYLHRNINKALLANLEKATLELDQLLLVLSPGALELGDEVRIKTIDASFGQMQQLYTKQLRLYKNFSSWVRTNKKQIHDLRQFRELSR